MPAVFFPRQYLSPLFLCSQALRCYFISWRIYKIALMCRNIKWRLYLGLRSFLITWSFSLMHLKPRWKNQNIERYTMVSLTKNPYLHFKRSFLTEMSKISTNNIFKNFRKILESLTHFQPIFLLDTPWKHHKTKDFLMVSGGIEVQHCLKMG